MAEKTEKKSKTAKGAPPKSRALNPPPAASAPTDGCVRIELRNAITRATACFDVKLITGRCRADTEFFGEFDGAPVAQSPNGELNFGWAERDRRRIVTNLCRRELRLGAQIEFDDTNQEAGSDRRAKRSAFEVIAMVPCVSEAGRELVRVGAVGLADDRSIDSQHRVRMDAIVEAGHFCNGGVRYGVWVDDGYVNPFSVGKDGVVDFGPLYEAEDRTYKTNLRSRLECRPTVEMCWTSLDEPGGGDWVFRIDRVTRL